MAQAKGKSKASPDEAGLTRLEKLMELMERHEVAELEWEVKGERIRLRKPGAQVDLPAMPIPHVVSHAAVAAPSTGVALTAAAPKAGLAPNQKQIMSPFVGTFYRRPSPTAEVYVREGQRVKRGDVLCIIEAMKLMNEIDAELDGTIIQILVDDAQPVEFGEPLFVIET